MKLLIIGGTRFLGRHIVEAGLEPGAPLVRAQGDVDADVAEIARDHLRGAHPVGPAADDLDREGEAAAVFFAHAVGAAAPAGLVEERGGGARVVAHPAVGGDSGIAPAGPSAQAIPALLTTGPGRGPKYRRG